VAAQQVFAAAPAVACGCRDGQVAAYVRSALFLGHAHPDPRGAFALQRAIDGIVRAVQHLVAHGPPQRRLALQQRYRAQRHAGGALAAGFDLRVHVKTRGPLDPASRMVLGKGAGVQAVGAAAAQPMVPGRVEVHHIHASPAGVKGF